MDPISLVLGIGSSLLSGLFGSKKTETTKKQEDSTTATSGRTLNAGAESELLSGLSKILGGGVAQSQSSLSKVLTDVNDPIAFDSEAFIKGITDRAAGQLDEGLTQSLNDLFSGIGAGPGGNSMALILKNQLQRKNAEELAGVTSDATARAAEIQSSLRGNQVNQVTAASSEFTKQLATILDALKGATVTQDSTTKTNTNAKGTSSTIGFDGSGIKLPTGIY